MDRIEWYKQQNREKKQQSKDKVAQKHIETIRNILKKDDITNKSEGNTRG